MLGRSGGGLARPFIAYPEMRGMRKERPRASSLSPSARERMSVRPGPALIPLSPAEEEDRLVLRALVRALGRGPGLYPVIYVGPLIRGGLLEAEAATMGGLRILSVAEAMEDARADRLPAPTRGAWLVHGTVEGAELPGEVRSWVERHGLMFDPRAFRGSLPPGGTPLRSALASGRPVFALSPLEMHGLVAAEARLRLEIEGCWPVHAFAPGEVPERSTYSRFEPGGGVVLRPGNQKWSDLADALAALVRTGVRLVVVLDIDGVDAFGDGTGWRSLQERGVVVRLSDEREDSPEDEDGWPPVEELLLGAPEWGPIVTHPLSFPLETLPLGELLQMVAVWGRDGALVLFNEERIGWVEVVGGEVRRAEREGDSREVVSVELAAARVRAMAAWRTGTVVFVPSRGESSRRIDEPLSLDRLVFELARLTDEARSGSVGGEFRPPPVPRLPAHAVAAILLRRGLLGPAAELLGRVVATAYATAEDELLLGLILAASEPQEAVACLRRGVVRLAAEGSTDPERCLLQVDATLNALLLEVRHRLVRPEAAWGVVERWLASAGDDWISTGRHAAILHELAARAGRDLDARRFLRRAEARTGTFGGEAHTPEETDAGPASG